MAGDGTVIRRVGGRGQVRGGGVVRVGEGGGGGEGWEDEMKRLGLGGDCWKAFYISITLREWCLIYFILEEEEEEEEERNSSGKFCLWPIARRRP